MQKELQNFDDKYHLSTDGYHFEYQPDQHDDTGKKATLYETKTGRIVDYVLVSGKNSIRNLNHFQVINHFEARLTLKQIL